MDPPPPRPSYGAVLLEEKLDVRRNPADNYLVGVDESAKKAFVRSFLKMIINMSKNNIVPFPMHVNSVFVTSTGEHRFLSTRRGYLNFTVMNSIIGSMTVGITGAKQFNYHLSCLEEWPHYSILLQNHPFLLSPKDKWSKPLTLKASIESLRCEEPDIQKQYDFFAGPESVWLNGIKIHKPEYMPVVTYDDMEAKYSTQTNYYMLVFQRNGTVHHPADKSRYDIVSDFDMLFPNRFLPMYSFVLGYFNWKRVILDDNLR